MLSVAVLAVTMAAAVHAYPGGAPTLTGFQIMQSPFCTSGNLRPKHMDSRGMPILPRNTPSPFTLSVDNANTPYRHGTRLQVTLRAPAGKGYKGFFITVDGTDVKGGMKGEWETPMGRQDSKMVTFCATEGMTHNDNLTKQAVTVLWNPPQNFTHGTVQFKATVVENHDTFYTGVLSNPVEADATVDTQSQYLQKKMNSMFSMFNHGGSAGGGLNGGMNLQDMMAKLRSQMSQMTQNQNPMANTGFGQQQQSFGQSQTFGQQTGGFGGFGGAGGNGGFNFGK